MSELKKINVITVIKKVSLVAHWEDGDPTIYTVSKKNEAWLDVATFQLVRANLDTFDTPTRKLFKSFLVARDGEGLRETWNAHHTDLGEHCLMEIVYTDVIKRITPLKPFVVRDPSGKLLKHFDTVEELRAHINNHPALKEMYNQ